MTVGPIAVIGYPCLALFCWTSCGRGSRHIVNNFLNKNTVPVRNIVCRPIIQIITIFWPRLAEASFGRHLKFALSLDMPEFTSSSMAD